MSAEFWFCKQPSCLRGVMCDDPIFCTQVDYALQMHFRRETQIQKADANRTRPSNTEKTDG